MDTVKLKWQTEGNLAVIYKIDNILIFYRKEDDPYFKIGQVVSLKEIEETNFYKMVGFSEERIPSDAFVDMAFVWA